MLIKLSCSNLILQLWLPPLQVPLGQYPDEVAFEKHMRGPIAKFQKKLKEIGEKIDKRSCLQDFPYEYMHPGKMENSVTM